MKVKFQASLFLCLVFPSAALDSLYVSAAPQAPRPYILPRLSGQAVAIGQQIYRFAVTGSCFTGSFLLLTTDAPASIDLGVLPHIHQIHYESFYCSKGRVAVWAETEASGDNAQKLTQGDYGAVPQNTTQTFQILDTDTTLTGVIALGGFEELYLFLGTPYESSTYAPFPPTISNNSTSGPPPPGIISALQSFDVYAELDYTPRRDFINNTAPPDAIWHNGPNTLAPDAMTPSFVAKNYGPIYLHSGSGFYQILAPLATPNTTDRLFTMGTISISPLPSNASADSVPTYQLSQPVAFQMEEGALRVEIEGYAPETIIDGDVVFVPRNMAFKYYGKRPVKFLYVTGGDGGLDSVLLAESEAWDSASWPVD